MRKALIPLLLAVALVSATARVYAGGGLNIGTLRPFVQAIFNGTINISGQTGGQAIAWDAATSSWTAQTVATPTPGWDDVLAVDANSGANTPIIASGQALVIGGATTAGTRLEVNSGRLDVREGDDSALAPLLASTLTVGGSTASGGIQLSRVQGDPYLALLKGDGTSGDVIVRTGESATAAAAGAVQVEGGANTSTGAAGNAFLVGGTASGAGAAGDAYVLGGQSSAGVDGSVFLGGNGAVQWEVEPDGDFYCIAGTGVLGNNDGTPRLNFRENIGTLYIESQDGTNRWQWTNSTGDYRPSTDSAVNLGIDTARALGVYADFTVHQRQLVNSSPVTLGATDPEFVEVDASGGTRTVNLPAVATTPIGRRYVIKDNGSAGTNNITVDGSGGELIDGAATYTISTNYASVTIVNNGTKWLIE